MSLNDGPIICNLDETTIDLFPPGRSAIGGSPPKIERCPLTANRRLPSFAAANRRLPSFAAANCRSPRRNLFTSKVRFFLQSNTNSYVQKKVNRDWRKPSQENHPPFAAANRRLPSFAAANRRSPFFAVRGLAVRGRATICPQSRFFLKPIKGDPAV